MEREGGGQESEEGGCREKRGSTFAFIGGGNGRTERECEQEEGERDEDISRAFLQISNWKSRNWYHCAPLPAGARPYAFGKVFTNKLSCKHKLNQHHF